MEGLWRYPWRGCGDIHGGVVEISMEGLWRYPWRGCGDIHGGVVEISMEGLWRYVHANFPCQSVNLMPSIIHVLYRAHVIRLAFNDNLIQFTFEEIEKATKSLNKSRDCNGLN